MKGIFMNIKNNQRYQTMDIKLKATFLQLMQSYDFEKITVKLICETAGVNRSTFYAHFQDIYHMMEGMENYLSEEMTETYQTLFTESKNESLSYEDLLLPLIRHMKKHQYFCKISLSQHWNLPLKNSCDIFLDHILTPQLDLSDSQFQYYRTFFQSGLTMVLSEWIMNGCVESEDEIAHLLKNCIPAIFQTANPDETIKTTVINSAFP